MSALAQDAPECPRLAVTPMQGRDHERRPGKRPWRGSESTEQDTHQDKHDVVESTEPSDDDYPDPDSRKM